MINIIIGYLCLAKHEWVIVAENIRRRSQFRAQGNRISKLPLPTQPIQYRRNAKKIRLAHKAQKAAMLLSVFRDLGNVVYDGEEDGAWDEELLDVVLLERVDDGKEPLEGDGHGRVDRTHPGHVQRAVAERDYVDRDVVAVP